MPYISYQTTKKLTLQQQVSLKKVSGELISIILKESEECPMIHIQDHQVMYYKGKENDCMKIDVQLWHQCEHVNKQKFVNALLKEVETITSIPVEQQCLTLQEFDCWGFQGKYNENI